MKKSSGLREHPPKSRNWSGNITFSPLYFVAPNNTKELTKFLEFADKSNKKIRPIGSGHSFTPLVATNDILLSMHRFSGVEEVNAQEQWALVKSGTTIHRLMAYLANKGFALPIIGDIDSQTLAGAICTGTHGSSAHYGNISSFVLEITFINEKYELEVVNLENNPELFRSFQISLGCLGIIVYIKISIIPLYSLEIKKNVVSIKKCLETFERDMQHNKYFEFFVFPGADIACVKEMNISPVKKHSTVFSLIFRFINEMVVENGALWLLCELGIIFPALKKWVAVNMKKFMANSEYFASAENAFATPRLVRFKEMEYAIPIRHAKEVIEELLLFIKTKQFYTLFPMEIRFVKQDNIILSPACHQDVAYIAVHAYHRESHVAFFDGCEKIFMKHNGRPHWGKLHTMTHMEQLYPEWNTFLSTRKKCDPEGRFLNEYLESIFSDHDDQN